MLRWSVFFISVLLVTLIACGPAISEGTFPIEGAPGYFLNDSGGNEKSILRVDGTGSDKKVIVVEARVDSYIVDGKKLVVARTPRFVIKDEDGFPTGQLGRSCQYIEIDIMTHEITKASNPSRGLACR